MAGDIAGKMDWADGLTFLAQKFKTFEDERERLKKRIVFLEQRLQSEEATKMELLGEVKRFRDREHLSRDGVEGVVSSRCNTLPANYRNRSKNKRSVPQRVKDRSVRPPL